jgi:hypothetical protein
VRLLGKVVRIYGGVWAWQAHSSWSGRCSFLLIILAPGAYISSI